MKITFELRRPNGIVLTETVNYEGPQTESEIDRDYHEWCQRIMDSGWWEENDDPDDKDAM